MGPALPVPIKSVASFKAPIQRTKAHAQEYIRSHSLPLNHSSLNRAMLQKYISNGENPIEHRMALVEHWNHEQNSEYKLGPPSDIRHIEVGKRVMKRLKRGNKAILKTTQQLPYGAGNNLHSIQGTDGMAEAMMWAKRGTDPMTLKDQSHFYDRGGTPKHVDPQLEDVSCDLAKMQHFPGGNCDEHATATFANLYNDTRNVRLKRKSLEMDHEYTQQGDSDMEDEDDTTVVVSDSWLPEAQSLRKKEFKFGGLPGKTKFVRTSRRGVRVGPKASIAMTRKAKKIHKILSRRKSYKFDPKMGGNYVDRFASRKQRKIVYYTRKDLKDPDRMARRRRNIDAFFARRRAIYKNKVAELRKR